MTAVSHATALITAVIGLLMFALTFVAALLYVA